MRLGFHAARFLRDGGAIAAVEFALILPFLVALLLGGVDVTQGVTARRKLALASNTVSDLVARAKEVSTADIDNVFTAGSAVFTPFDGSLLKTVITSVVIDSNGIAKVGWSRGKNAQPYETGAGYTFPDSFPAAARSPSSSIVVAELSFAYKPVVGYAIVGPITMVDVTYATPRLAPAKTGVPCTWAGCPPTS